MAVTAPQPERIKLLRETYKIIFTPRLVASRQELFEHLRANGREPGRWGMDPGTRSFDDLWGEFLADESLIAINPEGDVCRFIRTVTLYITRDLPYHDARDPNHHMKLTPEVLREFVLWPDGREEERTFANSGSEKLKWHERGPNEGIKRFLQEELGLTVPRRDRSPPLMRRVPPQMAYFKEGQVVAAPEIDEHASRSYPGVITHNQLFHYFWKMPRRYWRDTYREVQKNKTLEFRWTSTHAPQAERP